MRHQEWRRTVHKRGKRRHHDADRCAPRVCEREAEGDATPPITVLCTKEGEGGAVPLAVMLHACERKKQREAARVVCRRSRGRLTVERHLCVGEA